MLQAARGVKRHELRQHPQHVQGAAARFTCRPLEVWARSDEKRWRQDGAHGATSAGQQCRRHYSEQRVGTCPHRQRRTPTNLVSGQVALGTGTLQLTISPGGFNERAVHHGCARSTCALLIVAPHIAGTPAHLLKQRHDNLQQGIATVHAHTSVLRR